MTVKYHKETQELIANYYSKDRMYTKAILVLATIGVSCVIVILARVIQIGGQLDKRTQDIQNQMTCIGQYFTQTDRANLKIKSLDDCNIVRSN